MSMKDRNVLPALISRLRDGSRRERRRAARALGDAGDSLAVTPLCEALRADDHVLAENAAAALGRIGAREAAPSLVAALTHQSEYVRLNAAAALVNMNSAQGLNVLKTALTSPDGDQAYVAVWALAALRHDGEKVLIEILGDHEQSTSVCEEAARALGSIGTTRALPALKLATHGRNRFLRRAARSAIIRIEGRSTSSV